MGLYKYIREAWKKPKENKELWKERLISWRKEPVTIRAERPTRLDRARSLGYRAKKGIFIVRQRVSRGGHKRPQIHRGRRPKHYGVKMSLRKNYQLIAEERVQKNYKNMVVLNSYWVGQDGKSYWYEVIMIDPDQPTIKNDSKLNWISEHRSRVFQGKTSAGRKMRGLHKKGRGVEKARPSRRANKRRQ